MCLYVYIFSKYIYRYLDGLVFFVRYGVRISNCYISLRGVVRFEINMC